MYSVRQLCSLSIWIVFCAKVTQLKLLEGGGGGGSPQASSSSVESETEKVRLAEQNCQLNLALQAAMEENAHLNEKLLMSELCQEKMKEKLAELEESVAKAVDVVNESKTEEGALGNNMEAKNAMTALKLKVAAVQELQQKEEKTIMEHDITRFNASQHNSSEMEEGDNLGAASQTLKQNELVTQLNTLNKELAEKQQLAGTIGESDVKLAAMKKKYEEVLKTMEEEMNQSY